MKELLKLEIKLKLVEFEEIFKQLKEGRELNE